MGAPGHSPKDPFSHKAGVGYVFQRAGVRWSQQAILRGIEPGLDIPNYAVGTSVSISGSSVILGAPASYGPDVPEDKRTGAAYLYSRAGSNWTGVQKIAPRDGIDEDWFGGAVAINGDCTIIGAHLSDPLGIESGSVYICGEGSGKQPRPSTKTVPCRWPRPIGMAATETRSASERSSWTVRSDSQ